MTKGPEAEQRAPHPTVVLAVGAPEARAAPPGWGGQDPLLQPVHWPVRHTVPGEEGGSATLAQPRWAEAPGTQGEGDPNPTHMTLSLRQFGALSEHGCCEWTRNLSVLQAVTKVTTLDVW